MRYLSALCILLSVFLASCTKQDNNTVFQDENIKSNIMYYSAISYLQKNQINAVVSNLKQISNNYPYTDQGIDALALLIWVDFQKQEYVDATADINDFIRYYPTHKYIPWVMYINMLVNYAQVADYRLSQETTGKALAVINELQNKFPNTKYEKDAFFRKDLMLEKLAAQSMFVGGFYQKKELYVSAINHYQEVVEFYQQTPYVVEAMYRLVECWLAIGLVDEAYRTLSVMGYNYYYTDWYDKAYKLFSSKTKKLKEYEEKYKNYPVQIAVKS